MPANAKLKVIFLGGVDAIGKNMYVYEYGEDIIVVDCGSMFPSEDMLGIDLIIPDASYLIENQHKIRGYVFTHGHEDHIGATPYILPNAPAPVYGSRLTIALLENKLREHRIRGIPVNVVMPRQEIVLGAFRVTFINVNHSIAGAFALAITCPAGTVIHSGDFKIDFTPAVGETTDLRTLAAFGEKGVLALLCESTNIEEKGYTMSEREVGETFVKQFSDARGRVIIAMFASNIHRVQMLADSAIRFGRKICFVGRSMVNVSSVAMDIGELSIAPENLVDIRDLDNYRDSELLIFTTGAQGEPMSGLTRMAFAEHRQLQIHGTDRIIISADPIPGNKTHVSRVIDQLYHSGAEVVYEALVRVHVSGHACREEIKLFHSISNPKYFLPIHGEYRMLMLHTEMTREMGIPRSNIHLPEIGQVIEMDSNGIACTGTVKAGEVLLDGLGFGDVGNVVLRDRKRLAQNGMIIVAFAYDRANHVLISGPDLISRGFVYMRDNSEIIDGARNIVLDVIKSYPEITDGDWPEIKKRIKDELSTFISDKMKREPMIITLIVDLG